MSYFVTVKFGHWADRAETVVRRIEIDEHELNCSVAEIIEIGQHEKRVTDILRKIRQSLPHLDDKAYLYRWFPELAPPPPPPPIKPEPFNGDYLWTEVD